MKKSLAFSVFLSLLMIACGSDAPPNNNANAISNANIASNANTANSNIVNEVNNTVTNSPVANVPKIIEPENTAPVKNSNSQTKTNSSNTAKEANSNTAPKKGKPNEANKKADDVINNKNSSVKKEAEKFKKNVEKLIKDLP